MKTTIVSMDAQALKYSFSNFFRKAPKSIQEEFLRTIAKKADEEQREVVEKYTKKDKRKTA